MIHYQIDILLIHAAVVNQNNAPVGRNALYDPPCRRAVMQEIARKPAFRYHSHNSPRCSKSSASAGVSMKWIESGSSPSAQISRKRASCTE